MLKITAYHDERQTRTECDLLAWVYWPRELLRLVLDTIRTAVQQMYSDCYVVVESRHTKETFIPKGSLGHYDRQRIIKTSTFLPIFLTIRYEDQADYLADRDGRSRESTTAT